ncbi:erg10, acetyl-CoA C-acetyltransferase [Mycoemilia scoparia]|uniref:acetyl-CoA C-acetyltransferase n=1 Tax=Mycoemilia scoparia TaxID=417184 RepID=A0A9W8DQJ3_9FUNG|nr:erg10, acetyl-CoA C-acetyltransferase [Mycoemilia scoparia]
MSLEINPTDAYIVGTARTPVGSLGGSLASYSATKLGSIALKAALARAKVEPSDVEEIYLGNVMSANLGQNPARQVALGAGCTEEKVVGTTVNKVCASGLKAISLAAQSIKLGENDVVVAVGAESMSNVPYYMPSARFGSKYGNQTLVDGLVRDGLTDAYDEKAMGYAAEACSQKHEVTREQQDEFAISSYRRAIEARDSGKFDNEIVGIEVFAGRGKPPKVVKSDDELSRFLPEKFPTLRPSFPDAEGKGTVTPGNASSLSDGAAAVVIVSGRHLQKLIASKTIEDVKAHGIYKILSSADGEKKPIEFTTAPEVAIRKALERANNPKVDFYEFNEAFSVVGVANTKLLGLSPDVVNVHGGAVSIGHPLGCSGTRIVVSLCNVLLGNDAKVGAAAICNGGGGASAIVIERL